MVRGQQCCDKHDKPTSSKKHFIELLYPMFLSQYNELSDSVEEMDFHKKLVRFPESSISPSFDRASLPAHYYGKYFLQISFRLQPLSCQGNQDQRH